MRAPFIMGRILAANRKSTSPECAHADGPERDIPVPRLAPWGIANVLSSYRGRAAAWKSPGAMITSGSVVGGFREASRSNHCVRNAGRSGVTVVTTLVRLFSLRMRLRMRSRIRRSARPHFGAKRCEEFGRPRAVTTTGVMTHDPKKCEAVFGSGHAQTKGAHLQSASCLKIESGMRCDADDAISSMSWPGLSPPSTSCGP